VTKKLIVIMATTDPRKGDELGVPIFQASVAGVRFYCCSPNADVYDTRPDDLIAECAGVIGRIQLIEQIMDNDDVKVLSY
jgi:predicted peroxiredoxin